MKSPTGAQGVLLMARRFVMVGCICDYAAGVGARVLCVMLGCAAMR